MPTKAHDPWCIGPAMVAAGSPASHAGRLMPGVTPGVGNRPGEPVENDIQPEVELVPEVVPGFEHVLGGNLNQMARVAS